MIIRRRGRNCQWADWRAFTLQEVVFSMGIAGLAIAGLMTGHSVSGQRAMWSTYSQAAQVRALIRVEQACAARWDPLANPPIDELVSGNFPVVFGQLDLPLVGTNVPMATNTTTISTISEDPPLRLIRVDCTWSFQGSTVFTNTVLTYRSSAR